MNDLRVDNLRIDAVLAQGGTALAAVSESPRLDAELLLARALDVPRSFLFSHADEEMDIAAGERFMSAVAKRTAGMPLAYITGEKEFWSMTLVVTPATLVPRPETETLVEQALARISRDSTCRVLDLGTGTGAVALAIAKERPLCDLVATDVSKEALAVATENARRQQLPNIEFLCGDWIEPVRDRHFDMIVSNPPYVGADDPGLPYLQHEPRLALSAGADGLDAIRTIAAQADRIMNPGGALLIEHGNTQHDEIAALLNVRGWEQIDLARDLAGHPRVTIANRAGT